MNDLIVVEKIAQWQKLKALGALLPHYTPRVQHGVGRVSGMFQQEPRPGFTKATVSPWRVSLEARGLSEARGLASSSIII